MSGKIAAFTFSGVCIVLAILLLFGLIGSLTSGSIFAVALVLLGGLSKGFKKQ
jgi:hypothetical protein